ncbi:hypothetical protein [Burkholderia ubonensis]|uniref:hypothetical protein n=1 Tax=Burkholderia ubonensis TaxID=101571 RepID=UPI0007C66DD7|nr:hypothetical protein [Burkholderia ubonensis]
MPNVRDLSAAVPARVPLNPVGKTVNDVVLEIEATLRAAEIEPEWVSATNMFDLEEEAECGLKSDSSWPQLASRRSRISLSLGRGRGESWLVRVDAVYFAPADAGGSWRSQPLVEIKVRSRSDAWAVAAVVSRLLDID